VASVAEPTDPSMWSGLLHAGLIGSFMRLPYVPPDSDALKRSGAKAAIYGLPWDATNISRTGANYGPRGIREVSCQFLTYNARLDFDFAEVLKPVDTGDCEIALANPEKTFARAQKDIASIMAAGALPVTLGGDHSITIPGAWAARENYQNPALVLIDAHLDTAPHVGGELLNHCCPVTRAVDAGFDPRHVVLVAMSGWMNPRTEIRYCKENGITVIWIEEIEEHGVAWAIEKTLAATRGSDGIYLSFDIDSLDAAHAPGTCCPTPGGLSSREAIALVRGIAAGGLVGADVAETAPTLEPTQTTTVIAARIVVECLAAHARSLGQ
jgi:guanidinobutyrase